jgi:hypothetical protein
MCSFFGSFIFNSCSNFHSWSVGVHSKLCHNLVSMLADANHFHCVFLLVFWSFFLHGWFQALVGFCEWNHGLAFGLK